MNLRAHFLLLVLLATLAPAMVVGIYQYRQRNIDIEEAKRGLAALANYAAENLDDKVKGTVQLLHGLSRTPDIDTADKAACSQFLAEVLGHYPQYTGLLTIAPNGDLHCDSLRSGRRLNLTGRAYFKQVSASLEPAFDVVFGGLTGIAVLQVAYPVLDGHGALKYVMVASLNLSQYAQSFAAASQYPSIRIQIWDRTGNLMVLKPDAGGANALGKDFAASELFRFAASGNAGTAAELPDLDGAPRVWALGVIPEPRGGGARITLGIPRGVLLAEANRSLRNALAVLIAVSLLAFIGAWYVAETGIRRHLRRIANVAGRVGAGELGARIGAPYPRGELGELMAVVDRTSGAVQAQQAELESRSRDLQRLNRIHSVLSSINSAIVRIGERQALLAETCRIAVEQGRLGLAWIGALDPATLDITPVAWAGEGSEETRTAKSTARDDPPRGQGAVSRAVRERRAIFNNDLSLQSFGGPRRDAILKLGFRSMIALPLLAGDKVVGAFTLYAREPGFFDENEVALLTELAGNVSFALDHMARQEKIEKMSRIRAISSEINVAIIHVRERNALLEKACRIVSEQGKFQMVWIGTIDQEKQAIEAVAWTGFSEEIARRVNWKSVSAAQGTVGEAIKTRKTAVRHNIESELPVGGMRGEALKQGCRSGVSLPLVVDGRVVALISLFAAGTGYFDKDELALLDEVASNISFALEHIEREEKFARLSRIEAVMGRISELIVRARDRDELFRDACRIAVDEGRIRMSLIGIVDRSTMQVVPVASAGKDEELLASIRSILSSSEDAPKTMVARAIREKKAVVSNDSQSDSGVLFGKQYAESGVRSMAVLPLIVSDEAVGVLALYSEENGFFDDEEMKLLTELTGNIAFAIDHIAKQERLDYLAYYDPLTGLANRTLFLERVAQSIRDAAGGGHKLALIMFDLDRFKNINDSLGRAAGDILLKQVAAWMTRNLGNASLLARVDADHFAVVLPEVRQDGDVARLIEKTMAAFMAHPFLLRDSAFRIAIKAGIALFPDDGADADTLFRNAEAALKKTKSSGERYLFYSQKMTEAVASRLALETQLREALDKGEFVLHYQPKMELASGAVRGLEALIRWQKPGSGLVAPGAFIPLLEETGLILGVGKWALSRALAQHREWTARGIAAPRIAVNVSAIQIQQKNFSDVVTRALQEQGDNPDALELEVTESLLMQDVQQNIRTLSLLRGLGIHIAMDDFGTGYSSLSYLARLPLNSLKIDRSFIAKMANSSQDMTIVTTIIALAHSLNLRVVAEGVETAAQSRLLKLLKCDEAQGYLFSKPLPAAEIEPLLRTLASAASEPERV